MKNDNNREIENASLAAEEQVAARCQAWGYTTTKIPRQNNGKSSDFRVSKGSEKWVVEVKSRQGDKAGDQAVRDGQQVEYSRSSHADPTTCFHPMAAYRKAATQLVATRQPDELTAVWFVLSDNPSDAIDPESVASALLGSRTLFDFATETVPPGYQ